MAGAQHSLRPLAGFKGPTSKGKEGRRSFLPHRATRCTEGDGREIWHGGVTPLVRGGVLSPQNWFYAILENNCPIEAYPLGAFNEILWVCGELNVWLPSKIWADLLVGFQSYGGLKLWGVFPQNFSAP